MLIELHGRYQHIPIHKYDSLYNLLFSTMSHTDNMVIDMMNKQAAEHKSQCMNELQAEVLDGYEEFDYQPEPEQWPTHVTFEDIVVGGIYFSDVHRQHYYITSAYNDPIKWKIFRAKIRSNDKGRSDKKTQLHTWDINNNYFRKSTNINVLSSINTL